MFVPVRDSYLPNNWLGWLTYLPFLAYLAFSLVYSWRNNTWEQAVLLIVPNWVAAAAVMTWIARRTS